MSAKRINPAEGISGSWANIKELFAEAIEIDPASRATWIQEKCRDNPVLAQELASLLAHDHSGDDFLETPAWRIGDQRGLPADPEERKPELQPGTLIGGWRVLHEISSGGMGTVYLAERAIDDEDRPVIQRAAIKITRTRVNATLLTGRFRRERRILAQLNHPFIARFLEGGTLENGLPYFALDYVDGEPIDNYCHNRRLNLEAILQLFAKVCSAVAYAHRNLVVHRDLKPSNILVTPDGTPLLLDFGIAKLLADQEESLNQTGALAPYTPRYCSPEQIRGEPVTTASDIFVLGIILHQLVTGLHPFDPVSESGERAAFEILRRICEDEPRKTRGGRKRSAESKEQPFYRPLKGDLESIVLKALQKVPADRYKAVEYLMDDIQNFLDRRPVLARPQNWWYRTRILAKRHPTATLAVSAAAVVGIVALAMILASDRSARRERDYAFQQRELAASSARTMINDVASSLESMSAPIERRLELLNRVATIFDQIDATSRGELDPAMSAVQIRAEAQTQLILARALEELDDIPGAIHRAETGEFHARRLLYRQPSDPLDQLSLAEVLLQKCQAVSKTGNSVAATGILQDALTKLRELENIGDLTAEVRRKLQILLCDALVLKEKLSDSFANPDDALQLLVEATARGEVAYGTQPSDRKSLDSYANSLESLGRFYFDSARSDLFAEPIRRALALRSKAAADAPNDSDLQHRSELAVAHWASFLALADPQVPLSEESLAALRKFCASDPNNVSLSDDLMKALGNYGVLLATRNEYEEAKKLFREAIGIGQRLTGQKKHGFYIDDNLQYVVVDLSHCCCLTGDFEEARKVNKELLAPLTAELETFDPDKSNNRFRKALSCLVQAEVAAGDCKWKEAQQLYSQAVRYLEENVQTRDCPFEREAYGDSLARLGRVLAQEGELEPARRYIEQGLHVMYALRTSGRCIPRSSLLRDISDAEEAFGQLQKELNNAGSSPVMATN